MSKSNLSKPVTTFRANVSLASSSDAPEAVYEGGDFNAGMIKNFSVIASGEALGHGMWIDSTFIEQVGEQLSANKKGVVSRFTHPNQSGDALSKGLGRVKFVSMGDGKVRGDLHFYKAAHKSPDGNLAEYLMDLASDDPESFGASIAFSQDPEASETFAEENPSSPDARNVDNLPHVRLGQLRFVDMVASPAANPEGLFSSDTVFQSAEALLSYMLGLSEAKPDTQELFSVDADRLASFTTRFLETHGLTIMSKEENINETPELDAPEVNVIELTEEVEVAEVELNEEVEVAEVELNEEVAEVELTEEVETPEVATFSKDELASYITAFGKDSGVDYFMNEVSFSDAQSQHIVQQNAEIAQLRAQVAVEAQTSNEAFSSPTSDEVAPKQPRVRIV